MLVGAKQRHWLLEADEAEERFLPKNRVRGGDSIFFWSNALHLRVRFLLETRLAVEYSYDLLRTALCIVRQCGDTW